MSTNMLHECWRPKTLRDIVGHTPAKRQISQVLKYGWGGRAWWISGPSGSGKTTFGRIIAKQGADDFFIQEFDSGHEVTTEVLDQIDESMNHTAWGKGGRCIIINEAHGLRLWVVRRLLGMLERIPKHFCWIFTTTAAGQLRFFEDNTDATPLLSRCVHIELETKNLTYPFARLAKRIAKQEHLGSRPLAEYVALAKRCNNNMRMILSEIEAGKMRRS